MNKGLISFLIIFVLLLIVTYIYTGFNFSNVVPIVTHKPVATTTVPKSSVSSTSPILSLIEMLLLFAQFAHAGPITPPMPVTTLLPPCNGTSIVPGIQTSFSSGSFSSALSCSWHGGNLALWAGSGSLKYMQITVVGAHNQTYMYENITNPCVELEAVKNLPMQNYTIYARFGPANTSYSGNSSCSYSYAILNTTLEPKSSAVYSDVFNGDFSTGTYSGWNVTGNAFGTAPLDINYADENNCYPGGIPWMGYSGTYFATTYSCTLSTRSSGNITSSYFLVNKPFLNFQIIGCDTPYIYVEVLYKNSPAIIAHFNTYKISTSGPATFTFRNASLPLATLYGKPVRIRVVVNEIAEDQYVAIGNFHLSVTPTISTALTNVTIVNLTS